MMVNLNSYMRSFVLLSLFGSIGLYGCQSAPIKGSQQLPTINDSNMNKSIPPKEILIKESQVIQWTNGYDWQLAQVINATGHTIPIPTTPPIEIEVAPDDINLKQGCLNYGLEFMTITAPPFPYHGSYELEIQSTCTDNNSASDSVNTIDTLFPSYPYFNFNLELISPAQSHITTNSTPKRLALVIERGNTLIFEGKPKALLKPTGLPISNELLEHYQWQLVSAVSNTFDDNGILITRAPIGDFYHPDFPISLSFSDSRDQYASFYANCNYGIGGPYALLKDNTLLIGSGMQTVMGCGLNGNRVEDRISNMMTRSKSELSLSIQTPTPKLSADFSHYNLLQTMDSGETLVWQNKPLPERKYLTSEPNQEALDIEIDTSEAPQSLTHVGASNE